METSNIRLYSLTYSQMKTYMLALAFVAGNIILPQLCHLIPGGGLMLLPIYFFTLVGAYKYGWKVGLLTAIASPLVNYALFGMPALAMVPVIMLKSGLLAVFAGLAANHFKKISIAILALVVIAAQLAGVSAEWLMTGDFMTALQGLRIAIPGVVLQIFGGYAVIAYLLKN